MNNAKVLLFCDNISTFVLILRLLCFPNTPDDGGRYAYNKQPTICKWNLKKLAEALRPCLDEEEAEESLKM